MKKGVLKARYTVKRFFQSISWNTVSGTFHEIWSILMKHFYLTLVPYITVSLRTFLINKKNYVYRENIYCKNW